MKSNGLLPEVEAVGEIISVSVGIAHRVEAEYHLNEAENEPFARGMRLPLVRAVYNLSYCTTKVSLVVWVRRLEPDVKDPVTVRL